MSPASYIYLLIDAFQHFLIASYTKSILKTDLICTAYRL
jgi:hypothetical protein